MSSWMAFKWMFTSSRFRNFSGYVFFYDLFTYFHDFWSQIGVVILVTPKQEMERKSEWFCGVNFFRSSFKVEWGNGVWTKIRFLGIGFFCSHAAISLWFLLFFRLIGSDFFSKWFSNPFTAHSRPSFLFELKFHFSLGVFLLTCGILILILFFSYLFSFFLKWFSEFTHSPF